MVSQGEGTLWEMTRFSRVITLIGAGGKTTTLQLLTKEIQNQGEKVIATTTTKTYPLPFETVWVSHILPPPAGITYPCFWYGNTDTENNKWIGPSVEKVDQAIRDKSLDDKSFDHNRNMVSRLNSETDLMNKDVANGNKGSKNAIWLIEGDGAREKKLKCWDSHEPQIPHESQCVILVIHGGLWGNFLTQEEIHRSEKSPGLVGKAWTGLEAAEYILNSPVFYPHYHRFQWIVLFNEYKTLNLTYGKNTVYLESLVKQLKKTQRLRTHPAHLRIVSGNIKEGKLRWYDLW
jgi:probable selenium-dependent hydroxylase accessory protein YqeC